MNAFANPLTEAPQEEDLFVNEVAMNAAADSGTADLSAQASVESSRPDMLSADTTYEEFLAWFEGSGIKDAMEDYYSYRPGLMNALDENTPGYERNEAGRYINENGEALFYFTGPDYNTEYKNGAGLNADADYLTGAEIKSAYDDDRVLQETFGSFDKYWSYINDRQNLIDSGQLFDRWSAVNQLWSDTFMRRRDGRGGPNGQYIADIITAERQRVEAEQRSLNEQLLQQYGIQTNITDTNGNQLRWNGSGYALIERYKEDDKWGRKLSFAAAGAILTAGLSPALTGLLGSTAGSAAASAISNSAMQLIQDGKLSLSEALMAGATAALGDVVAGQLEGLLGTATETVWDDVTINNMANVLVENGTFETIQEAYQYVMENGPNAGGSLVDLLGDITGIGADVLLGNGNNPEWQPNDASTQGSGGWVQDPETGKWGYDPSAVQTQYPDYNSTDDSEDESGGNEEGGQDDGGGSTSTTDTDGDGIPDDVDEYPNDPTNTPPANGGGQYEVVKVNPDGTVLVKDNVDGDVWIVKGDYKVGDIITEDVMATDTVGAGDPDWDTGTNPDTATDTDGDGIADADDPWPDIPNLPGIDPTVPGNELPDGTQVPTPTDPNVNEGATDGDECDHISEDGTIEKGVIKDGYCTLSGTGTNPTPSPNPNGSEEGNPCEIDGQAGTIQGGVCVPSDLPSTPGEGEACTLADGTTGTIQGGVCTSADSTGGGANEGDACTLADGSAGTIQGGVCKGTGGGGGGNEGDACQLPDGSTGTIQDGACKGSGDGTCTLPDGTTGTLDANGECQGNGDGNGDGDGDGKGLGMLAGIAGGSGGSTTKWSPIREQAILPKYVQHRAELTASLWNDVMKS